MLDWHSYQICYPLEIKILLLLLLLLLLLDMQVIIFQKELYAYHWTTRKKTYVPCLRIELPGSFMRRCLRMVGALCEGSMRIELRSELYAKGALCGFTVQQLKYEIYYSMRAIITVSSNWGSA